MSFQDSRLWDVLLVLKDHGPDVDLTKKWVSIEYEDTYPQSAIITLSASRGRFCTTGTIIEKWDRLFLKITDQNGASVSTVVHVESLQKQRNEGGGLFLRLYCPHQSSNLLKQTISRPNRRTSGNKAMQEIVDQINQNTAISDPSIEIETPFDEINKLGNSLDDTTTNDYIFESIKVTQAVDELIRREGNPVETGGSFQFMYFRLVSKYDGTNEADLDFVLLQVFPQGFVFNTTSAEFSNIPNVTLTKPTLESEIRANILSLDSDLQTEKGTNLIAIGDKNSGSYPIDYSRFLGAKEVFEGATEWTEGRVYSVSSLVTFPFGGTVVTFTCIQANTAVDGINDPSTGLGTFWVNALFEIPTEWTANPGGFIATGTVTHNEIGYTCIQTHAPSNSANEPPNPEFWQRTSYIPTTNYSPLTNEKAQYWVNALGGAKHAATENFKSAIVDANIIIKDQFHPRTWVDTVQEDPADIPSTLLEGGTAPFHTLRALAINPSTGANPTTGPWAPGNFDKNDVAFAGSILEFQDNPLEIDAVPQWVVINSSHPNLPQAENDQEVYDFDEGDSWIKNPCTLGTVNGQGVCSISRSSIWQKGAYSTIGGLVFFQSDKQFDCIHPVQFDSGNNRISVGNEQIIDELNSDTSAVFIITDPGQSPLLEFNRNRFCGINFAFPFPRTSNDIPFGSVSIGEQIALTQFDFLNMHLTKDNQKQWFGARVEDYYPIQAFEFTEKISHTIDLLVGSLYAPLSNYEMGLWVTDRLDNQWMMDYTHGHNDVTSPQSATFGARKVYRGVPGVSTFIPAQEPEVLDIVDPRSIVRGGIQTKDSYDNQGRYNVFNRFLQSQQIKLSYDSFRMTKPLITTNNDDANGLPERNIEPLKLQFEKITSYSQLKNYVLTMEQILGFQPDAFTIRAPGRCNIQYGDPVYYTDPEAINETTDSLANTIKATASKITYSLSKTADGPVGFYRAVELITRLYPVES